MNEVIVKNPSSMQHLVRIQSGQTLVLSLDDAFYEQVEVEVSSEMIYEHSVRRNQNCSEYRFLMSPDVKRWCEYSSAFLGEIWIGGRSSIAKLAVIVEAIDPQKRNVITAINPTCYDIRLKPYNILELVVYDQNFSFQDQWVCEWKPSVSSIKVEQLDYSQLWLFSDPTIMEPDCAAERFARCPRVLPKSGTAFKQHHFWYRFTDSILEQLTFERLVHVGDFIIHGLSNRYDLNTDNTRYNASIYTDLKKKYKSKVAQTLKSPSVDRVRVVSNNFGPTKFNLKPLLPKVMDVDIKVINYSGLDDGCQVVPSIPPSHPQVFVGEDTEFEFEDWGGLKYARSWRS